MDNVWRKEKTNGGTGTGTGDSATYAENTSGESMGNSKNVYGLYFKNMLSADANDLSAIFNFDNTGSTGNEMTYEKYIAQEKAREEEKRQAALKEAEIYKERAAADAQASYMQNMSTYGVNAETMAQMGLTGGGYSDYLNAQTYAQKRSDMQTASANEIALKQQAQTTYADGIAALNKNLLDYQETQRANKQTGYNTLLGYAMDAESGITEETVRAMANNIGLSEEEIQQILNIASTTQTNAQGEYSKNAFTALIADVQSAGTYGNYSEAGIRALGKQWGWTDEQIQQAVDIWKDAKKSADILLNGEETQIVMSDVIKAIKDGTLAKEDGTPYSSWEEIKESLLRARNDGQNITQEDIDNAKKAYEQWIAYKDGKISTDDYYNAINGDEQAQVNVDRATNIEKFKEDSINKAKELIANSPGGQNQFFLNSRQESVTDNVVDVYSKDFTSKSFGSYKDTGKKGSGQENYMQSIISDAKAGKIPVGAICTMNYGNVFDEMGRHLYIGDGVFVKLKSNASTYGFEFYAPDGYEIRDGGAVFKD